MWSCLYLFAIAVMIVWRWSLAKLIQLRKWRKFFFFFYSNAYFIPEGGLKELRAKLAEENFDYFDREQQFDRPSPRHFKTHLLFELLPDNLVDKAKVFYIAREVKDVIVSRFHYEKYANALTDSIDFKTYCLDFIQDRGKHLGLVSILPIIPVIFQKFSHELFVCYIFKEVKYIIACKKPFINTKSYHF